MLGHADRFALCLLIVCCAFSPMTLAQQAAQGTNNAVVPMLINYSGSLTASNGKPLTGTVGVTFSLYQNQEGGAPLWLETQNLQLDKTGHYSVQLGAASSQGLPASLFAGGEARWLGVQAEDAAEQPRTLLMSVPYALKALDAETIGGRPASSFMLAPSSTKGANGTPSPAANITGSGTADFVPVFTGTTTIGNSKIYQNASGEVGIGTTSPLATLDVKGKTDVRDSLTLYPKLTHPALTLHGTAFEVSSTGLVTFVSGQTFPGTGTVTQVNSGAGLTGGPITGSGTLSIASAGVTNAMLANSSLTLNANSAGGLTTPGAISLGSTGTIGLKPCSASQVLEYISSVWTCTTPAVGTITDINTGTATTTGLTGGTTSGTANLSVDSAVVPFLAAGNTFTTTNTINGNSTSSPALTVTNAGWDGIDLSAPGTASYGVWVESAGLFGVNVDSSYQGGYFYGPYGGTYSDNATDSQFSYAAFAYEGGTTQQDIGFEGYSASAVGIGAYGQAVTASLTGFTNGAIPTGIWGDTGEAFGQAITASADDGWSLVGYNNSDSLPTLYLQNNGTGGTGLVIQAMGKNGQCDSDVNGNFNCTGGVSTVAPVRGGSAEVALTAIHSPENWFEDAGSGQLSAGQAVVHLESLFGETVNTGVEYHVFLTPKGDCKGLYVAQESASSFVVKELGGGSSNIAFDYRIMAKRKGFETVRLADKTQQLNVQNIAHNPLGNGARRGPNAQDVHKQVEERAKQRTIAQASKPALGKKK
jgi:hypothetical protein